MTAGTIRVLYEENCVENESLNLLQPPDEKQLLSWLAELYGKQVAIADRQLLRHRDLSLVERLWITDGLPETLIYKVVLPPWDVEQDLHERVLIPSICNSAQLYMTANLGAVAVMFFEDLGSCSLKAGCTTETALHLGRELSRMHRAFSYRSNELLESNVLPKLLPADYEKLAQQLASALQSWQLIESKQAAELLHVAALLAGKLAGEPISLVHGDCYAENLLLHNNRLFIIDWSWFTFVGAPVMDLATVTMDHLKNGSFAQFSNNVIDAYCFESGRNLDNVKLVLPPARLLSRLLLLHWLVERRSRGILGTTVGPVDKLIPKVVAELTAKIHFVAADG